MRSILSLILLLCGVTAQSVSLSNQVGQASIGTPNACWTTASMYCSTQLTLTLPGCTQSMGVFRLNSTAQIAGTAGFLWPTGTEGPILFAIEIAPSSSCTYPVPPAVVIPGSASACGNLWMSNASLFLPQWQLPLPIGPGFMVDLFWLDIPIPNDPALVGHWIVSQTLHLSPTSGLWNLSPRHEGVISF